MHCVNTIAEIGFILFTQLYLKWRPGKVYFKLEKKDVHNVYVKVTS